MATKLPKPFRTPLDKKKYEKKIAKRIYLKHDLQFLEEITTTDAEGRIVLSRPLHDKEKKRLTALVKQAKKNKGAVSRGKFALLLIIIAGALVFSIVFKNALMERGAERLLEAIFVARVDFDRLRFRPLDGSVSFGALSVADRNAPLRNLFEMGEGRFDINLWQLANGHVVIEDVTVAGLEFNTEREQSGALPGRPREDVAEVADETVTERFLRPEILGFPQDMEPRAFVQENAEALDTPELVESTVAETETFVAETTAEIEQLTSESRVVFADIEAFAGRDFQDVSSVDEGLLLFNEANTLYEEATAITQRIRDEFLTIEQRADELIAAAESIPESVDADLQFLLSLLPDLPDSGGDLLSRVAEPYLRDTLGAWYGRLQGAYDYLQRVGSIRESRAEATDERVGQLVVFPTVEYPAFLLQNAYFATEGETIVEATLSDLSSDQELSNAPTTINYTSESRERYLSLGALFDARADAATQLALNFSVTDVPLAIEEGLDSLGFALFEGSAEIDASFTKAETTTGSATIEISVPSLQGGQGGNTVGLLVRDVLAARETISITVAFMVDEDGSLSLERSSTNLDDALSDVVTARVDAAIAEAREELANALEGFLNPYLEQASTALDGVVDVETDAAELLRLARDREAAALAARNLASDVVQGYRNELEREAQERIDQAQQEAQEAAERAAEEARGEAEDAVEDQVDELRRRLPLPGF